MRQAAGSPSVTLSDVDNDDLKAQGQRLRRLRARKLVSQEAAAHDLGVSVRAYREWETGRGGINRENINKLLAYYETTDSYLRFGREVEWVDLPTESAQDILAQVAANTKQVRRNSDRLDSIEETLDQLVARVRELTEGLVADGVLDAVARFRRDEALGTRQAPGSAS